MPPRSHARTGGRDPRVLVQTSPWGRSLCRKTDADSRGLPRGECDLLGAPADPLGGRARWHLGSACRSRHAAVGMREIRGTSPRIGPASGRRPAAGCTRGRADSSWPRPYRRCLACTGSRQHSLSRPVQARRSCMPRRPHSVRVSRPLTECGRSPYKTRLLHVKRIVYRATYPSGQRRHDECGRDAAESPVWRRTRGRE
jgi:hypothetical protein